MLQKVLGRRPLTEEREDGFAGLGQSMLFNVFPRGFVELNSSHTNNLMCFLESKTAGAWGTEVKTAGFMGIGLGTKIFSFFF